MPPPKNVARRRRSRLSFEELEARDVPSTLIYEDVFDFSEAATVTVTVTEDAPGYEDKYLWNYHVHNNGFEWGPGNWLGMFAIDIVDPDMVEVSDIGNNMGWYGAIGELTLDPNELAWQAGEFEPQIEIGESGDFWFTTPLTAIHLSDGFISDTGYAPEIGGPVAAPHPTVLVTTATDETDPENGLFSLREAITYTNLRNLPGQMHIRFLSTLAGHSIILGDLGSLPQMTCGIFIDGYERNGNDLGIHVQRDPTKDAFRLMSGSNASTVTIGGLWLENGGGLLVVTGGAISTDGILTLNECKVKENQALKGGGIYSSTGALTIQGGFISQNKAADGGGIFADGPSVTITNTPIYLNEARVFGLVGFGAGGGVYIGEHVLQANLDGCEIASNTADTHGGGVYVASSGTLPILHTIENCFIHHNTANKGGGIGVSGSGTPVVRLISVLMTYNEASSKGGAVYLGVGTLAYSYTIVNFNYAPVGGGIYVVTGATWAGPNADPANSDISLNADDDWNEGPA